MIEKESFRHLLRINTNKIREVVPIYPKLIFSDRQSRDIINPLEGIREYGPYDINTSDNTLRRWFKGVEIYAFYPEKQDFVKRGLRKLINYLENGYIPKRRKSTSEHARDVEFNGLKDEFKIEVKDVQYVKYTPGQLNNKLKEYTFELQDYFDRGNVPIVIIGGTSHRSIVEGREQYIEAKYEFTRRDIPCQYAAYYDYKVGGAGILYYIMKGEIPLGYPIWNFALNLYGKCGGLAWVVPQTISKDDNEVIDLTLGLRFSLVRHMKTRKKYMIGYITILDRFGKLAGVFSTDPFEISFNQLRSEGMVISKDVMKRIIVDSLEIARRDSRINKILEEKSIINVAIHRLAHYSGREIKGIQEGIKDYYFNYKQEIRIGLVSIIEEPYACLLRENIKMGTCFSLNENTILIYTAGSIGEYQRRRMNYPIVAQLQNLGDGDSPFTSIEQLASHLLALSSLHWQTIVPGLTRLPASLEFARSIAYLAKYGVYPSKGSWLWRTLWFI